MKTKSILAGASALAISAASILPAAGVFAATVPANTTYSVSDKVYISRTLNNLSNPAVNDFGYTLTRVACGADDATTKTVTGVPSGTISFVAYDTVTSGSTTKTSNLDFSNVTYSDIGDYCWTIAETSSSDTTNYPLNNTTYTIQASVRYAVDDSNVPNNNAWTVALTVKDSSGDKKDYDTADGTDLTWSSNAARTYISMSPIKTTGNAAIKDNCFAYEVDFPTASSPALASESYTISTTSTCTGSDTSVTPGTAATVYLKNGDTLTIGENSGTNEIPVNAPYTITKTNTTDGYTTFYDGSSTATAAGTALAKTTVATDNSDFNSANVTAVENNKEYTDALTGIISNVWFYVVLAAIASFGIFAAVRRRQDQEEE